MSQAPNLKRLDRRIQRSKRSGKLVLGAVLLLVLAFGAVLAQGLSLAVESGRDDLVIRGLVGLVLLVGLVAFSVVMIRRQHRMLDQARGELEALVKGEPPD